MSRDTIQNTKSVNVSQRDYLTDKEVDLLIGAVKKDGRYGKRNALMILMTYRHGLRCAELVGLTWDQINLTTGKIDVYRKKGGEASRHPLNGDELKQLKAIKKETESPFVFPSERGDKMTTANVRMMFQKWRKLVNLDVHAHAHALRHACGHTLADKNVDTRHIQDYLGHKNIQNTVRYTKLSDTKFKNYDKLI